MGAQTTRFNINLILRLTMEKGLQKLQVMGDPKIIVDSRGASTMRNFHLRTIFYDVNNLKNNINEVSFVNVYRENNVLVDSFSKLGV
jgi:hypothetical protein